MKTYYAVLHTGYPGESGMDNISEGNSGAQQIGPVTDLTWINSGHNEAISYLSVWGTPGWEFIGYVRLGETHWTTGDMYMLPIDQIPSRLLDEMSAGASPS